MSIQQLVPEPSMPLRAPLLDLHRILDFRANGGAEKFTAHCALSRALPHRNNAKYKI